MARADLYDFRFYLGTPSLNFVGTRGRRNSPAPVERIETPQRLAEWLHESGLLDVAVRPSQQEHAGALALREAIYRVAEAARTGAKPSARDVEAINDCAREKPIDVVLEPQLRIRRGGRTPVRAALSTLARDAIELLGGDRRALIRSCEMDDCGGLYVDDSRGRRRRWCSMERCGNRAKAAAFRERTR